MMPPETKSQTMQLMPPEPQSQTMQLKMLPPEPQKLQLMPPDAQDLEMYMLHLLTGAIASALGRARCSLKGGLEDPLKKLVVLCRHGSRALSRNFSTTIFVPMRHMMGTHEDVSLAVTLACRGSQKGWFGTCIMGSESGRLNMSWTPREQDMLQDAELYMTHLILGALADAKQHGAVLKKEDLDSFIKYLGSQCSIGAHQLERQGRATCRFGLKRRGTNKDGILDIQFAYHGRVNGRKKIRLVREVLKITGYPEGGSDADAVGFPEIGSGADVGSGGAAAVAAGPAPAPTRGAEGGAGCPNLSTTVPR